MNRRTLLKLSGATGMAISTTGCLGWLPWRDDSGGGDGSPEDEQTGADEDSATSGQQDTDQNSDAQNDSQNESGEDANETEQPEAANPEPEPENAPNESEYASAEEANQTSGSDDVTISQDELTTDSSGATVTGVATNDGETTLSVVDLEVVFKENGTAVTTDYWGTNNLGPGEEWKFEIRAEGREYSTVTDYTITVLV